MDITSLLPNSLVVAFGNKSAQGKDTAAKAILSKYGQQYGVKRYAFADALKVEMYDLLFNPSHTFWGTVGSSIDYSALPHPRAGFGSAAVKMAWVDDNKNYLGEVLQAYGTDYRRARDPFCWINALRRTIEREQPKVALVTDLRFKNEALFILACKGVTVRVVRPDFLNPARPAEHLSETELDSFKYDYEIHASTVSQLKQDACDLFDLIVAAQQPVVPDFDYAFTTIHSN